MNQIEECIKTILNQEVLMVIIFVEQKVKTNKQQQLIQNKKLLI